MYCMHVARKYFARMDMNRAHLRSSVFVEVQTPAPNHDHPAIVPLSFDDTAHATANFG